MTEKSTDIKVIFSDALEIPEADERAGYLDTACGTNAPLRQQVEILLQEHERVTDDFLKSPLIEDSANLEVTALTEGAGTVIGPYRLLEKIGEGGMAVVYMAQQTEPLKRRVALKIIKLGMDTKEVIGRFEVERQSLALMDHPNIARVFDAGATDTGRPYFAMELVRGVAITEYCDQNKLSTQARLELFMAVCHAVHHAHQKGIIHRDLKPSNIMVTLHDGKPVPKVIDFGIAKATNRHLTEKTVFTRYAQMIGTPEYMSPEQAEMSGLDVDTRTDIYSLGVVLYELLTGIMPFDPDTLRAAAYGEIQRIICEQEPPRPSTRISSLGQAAHVIAEQRGTEPMALINRLKRELEWIPMMAMRKDRTRRYPSASDVAKDINNYLNVTPLIAGPESNGYRVKKWIKRHRALVTVVMTVAATLVIGLTVSVASLMHAETARKRETRARQESQAVTDFLTQDLLASVNPERAKKSEVTLRYLLDTASRDIEAKFTGNPRAEAQIRSTLGLTYQKMGDYRTAESHLERVLDIQREEYGEDHPDTLNAMNHLGLLYAHQGKKDEADTLLIKTLNMRKRLLGEDHPETLESMANLGYQYICRTDFTKGQALVARVCEIGGPVLGEENPVLLKAMYGLAATFNMVMRYAEAEPLATKGYAISRRVLGDEHNLTLNFMGVLCWIYLNQSRYDDVETTAQRALEICCNILDETHPITLGVMSHLGAAYVQLGRLNEAEPLVIRSVELASKRFGPDHQGTVFYSRRLADLFHAQQRVEEFETLVARLLETSRRIQGNHPQTWGLAMTLNAHLGRLNTEGHQQFSDGDYRGAADTFRRSAPLHRVFSGRPAPREMALRAIALHELGHGQDTRAQLAALRALYEHGKHAYEADALHMAERRCAPTDSPAYLAWEHIEADDLDRARAVIKKSNESTGDHSIDPPVLQNLTKALVRAYCRQAARAAVARDYSAAEQSYMAAMQTGPNDVVALERLAWWRATCPISDLRNGIEAIELATRACAHTQWETPEHIETLAASYAEAGDFNSARSWQRKAIKRLAPKTHQGQRAVSDRRLQRYASDRPLRTGQSRSLVARWDFDQAVGRRITDRSGNGHHGRMVDEATVTTDQERGRVLQLDGNGYVDCGTHPAFDLTDALSLSVWIKSKSPDVFTFPIINKGENTWSIKVSYPHNTTRFQTRGLDVTYDTTEPLSGDKLIKDGHWHHLVGIYDGTQMRLYVDATLDKTLGAGGVLNTNDQSVCIGADRPSGSHRWQGAIDDVRIYNYALSETDIQALYRGKEPVIPDD
jgi:eukaryotic-like serine/threonine-protein kinase